MRYDRCRDQNQYFAVRLARYHAAIAEMAIGNPFLKSGCFVRGVSAMISLLIRFRHYCKLKILVVNESMARFMLLVNLPYAGRESVAR